MFSFGTKIIYMKVQRFPYSAKFFTFFPEHLRFYVIQIMFIFLFMFMILF